MNFWPIDNNLIDIVGGVSMTQNGAATLTNDRFQNIASALSFNGGYYSVQPGAYFLGDFTVSFWGSLISYTKWSRIICFTNWVNNNWYDLIGFGLTSYDDNSPTLFLYNGNIQTQIQSNIQIDLNNWYHFAFTLEGSKASMYINGKMVANGLSNIARNVSRSNNYFGGSPYPNEKFYATIDSIKFYRRCLSLSEILNESDQSFYKISF